MLVMLTFSLQSGSNGNAIYVEANGTGLLFDAGISGKMATARMDAHSRDIRDVDAVLISHDHTDHIRCAGVWNRLFHLPVYMTRRTREATRADLGRMRDVRYFTSGDSLTLGGVTVHTIATAHDAADGVGFAVECEGKRLGILTDLGHPFDGLQPLLESLDAVYLESNYDPYMLANGDYPPHLVARIEGAGGHLSNGESAALIQACGRRRPRWVAASHLSEDNNRPELAIEAYRESVGCDYPVFHASRYEESQLLEV